MAYPAVPRNARGYDIENAINRVLRWLNPGFGADNAGKVLTSAGTDLEWRAPVQMVSFETGAVATGTTLIPNDDTIPQNTEGDQYMSLAITPKSATSKLVIEVVTQATSSAAPNNIIAALFQDSTANALAAMETGQVSGANAPQMKFTHVMTSEITSETTFKVRIGQQLAGTLTFNGASGGRLLGGVMASSIVIREYS